MVKLVEIGVLTPPVGLNLFAVVAAARKQISSGQMFLGVLPFLAIELVVLSLLIAFPQIVLWLPALMHS